MLFRGRCHCGSVRLGFESRRDPGALPVRRCACTFCSRHQPRYTSDPEGHVTVEAGDPEVLGRYRFGLKLADFLFCTRCGVCSSPPSSTASPDGR